MSEVDYDDVIQRITGIYNLCLPSEKNIFRKILEEVADKGYSQTLELIWLKDFTEVPVSIDRFICDSRYLGDTNDNGSMVYPFWKETLENIFTEDKNYSEVIFSGATRIGKTSTAITCMAYMLYRLMIYRDPHTFFHKKSVSKFTVAFANLTRELAQSVGYREFNDTLKMSPWFNDHGKFSKSERNYYYVPEGDRIEIISASDSAHLLGKQLWACLDGDSRIITSEGIKSLKECEGDRVSVYQYDMNGNVILCDASVVKTKNVRRMIKITLEDGTVLQGTPDHKILTSDGNYKQLCELTPEDEIMTRDDIMDDRLVSCLTDLFGDDYTSFGLWRYIPDTKNRYAICSSGKYVVRVSYKCDTRDWVLKNRVQNYTEDRDGYYHVCFNRQGSSVHRLVAKTFIPNPDNLPVVNHKDGNKKNNDVSNLEWCTPLQNTRHFWQDPCFEHSRKLHRERQSKVQTGLKRSKEVCEKLSRCHRGIRMSDEGRRNVSLGLMGHKVSDSTKKKIGSKNKISQVGKRFVNDGIKEYRINSSEVDEFLSIGYHIGRLKRVWVSREDEEKLIVYSMIDNYLSSGWSLGRY